MDCTLGGPSSKCDEFVLVDDAVQAPFKVSEEHPEINLVRRVIGGQPYIHAVPASLKGEQVMFGGNYIVCSDGRFPSPYPIPVHDRVER